MFSSKPIFLALAFGALHATGLAQNPRDAVKLNQDGPSNAGQVGVASADDLTAVVWSDGSSSEVRVASSDGRGVIFSSSVRVDADSFSKTTQTDSVLVAGDAVYVVWEANSDLYFARSLDRGATYSAPITVDDGGGNIRDWRFAMSPDPGGDHLYVLSSTAIGDEDLFLTSSHDGGANFGSAVGVPSVGSTGDVDALAIAADGNTVHVAWDDNRSGRDSVYYQRSVDGGTSFPFADVSLGDNVGTEDSQSPIEIAASGATIAVLWNEEPGGSGNEIIQVCTSTNGGLSFGAPIDPGTYGPTSDDTDFGHVAIDPATSNVLATWEDNRSGTDEAYVAVSLDGGLTFGTNTKVSTSGAEKPRFAGAGASGVTIVWESTVFPRQAMASLSITHGASWGAPLNLSHNAPDSNDFVTGTYNELYGNFIGAWSTLSGGDIDAYCGGFRPQSLSATNLTSNQISSFALSGFQGTSPLVWVLLSLAPGSGPILAGDPRTLGLQLADPLFSFSLNSPAFFLTSLDPAGNGLSPALPVLLPPGFTFLATAVSFDLTATVDLGEFTDVATFIVQ